MRTLLLLMVVVAVSLGVLEGLVRSAGIARHLYTEPAFVGSRDGTSWRYRPGFAGSVLGPTEVHIGPLGSRLAAEERLEGFPRVAIFGDSVTFGLGVTAGETFSAKLEERLLGEWPARNMFGNNIYESLIQETADALVASGLKDCGYEYVVIDDCWPRKNGRDGNGDLLPDPDKFPNGIKALAEYVHSLGLKIGIYSDAAELTCAKYTGSYNYEAQDAALWAAWGIDFLKYDYCHAPPDQATAIRRYARMGEALRKTGREFLYSLCEWGRRSPHLWGREVGGQMWRVTEDVVDTWFDASFDAAADVYEYGGPGGWNDLDMLTKQ